MEDIAVIVIFAVFLSHMSTHLVISKGTELHRFPLDSIVCIEASGNYSYVTTLDGKITLICLQLGQIDELLQSILNIKTSSFIRIGRGLIINREYIFHIDISKKVLIMSDCKSLKKELSASREALIQLKEAVENSVNSPSNT